MFEALDDFGGENPFIDGDGIEGSVKSVNIDVEKKKRQERKGRKGQNFPSAPVFFEDAVGAEKEKREEYHVELETEPDKKRKDKSQEEIAGGRIRLLSPEFPEQINGETGDVNGRIKVESKKKHRGGEAVQEPEHKGQSFPLPDVVSQEENLKPEEYGPNRQAPFDDEDQQAAFEQLAQGIKRQHQDGDARLVDGIDPLGPFFAEPAVFSQRDVGIDLSGVEVVVVLFVVVVGHVDILVFIKAVSGHEIIGFIP